MHRKKKIDGCVHLCVCGCKIQRIKEAFGMDQMNNGRHLKEYHIE